MSDYLSFVRERWWLPLAGLVLGGAFGLVDDARSETLFEARAEVLIQFPSSSFDSDVQARVVETTAHLAESDTVRQHLLSEIGAAHVSAVDASAAPGANVVELTVQSDDAESATNVANAYADALADVARDALDVSTGVITMASGATDVSQSSVRSTAMWAVVGLVLGTGSAIALHLRTRRGPTAEDAATANR